MMSGRVPLIGLGTFFVGHERCRLPEALRLSALMGRLEGFPGSLSIRAARGFVISSQQSGRGAFTEDDVVEVEDYDPVRHTCLVIGLREPSADTPLHWLAYRTDELTRAVCFVWDIHKRDGVVYPAVRHPAGSFDEALEVVALAKKSGAPAGVEGRGYLLRAHSETELLELAGRMAAAKEQGAGGRVQGAGTESPADGGSP